MARYWMSSLVPDHEQWLEEVKRVMVMDKMTSKKLLKIPRELEHIKIKKVFL